MGAANCCKKPDEIVIEEVKYSTTDNNKFTAIDQDSYPQDTEQVYRSNANAEDDNAQNQAVSNQNIYEQEGGSPKIGGAYEVPINVSSPQQNYEEGYESNNMGSPQQYESQNVHSQNVESSNLNQYEQEERAGYQYEENANMNQNVNSPMSRDENAYAGNQEEEGVDYNDLVNQMGNEANLKALRMGNAGLKTTSNSVSYSVKQTNQPLNNLNTQQINNNNVGGVDLNTLAQKGAIDLKNFTLGNQQGGNIATQSVRKVEYNKVGPTTQQKTTTTTTTIKKQADMNNYGLSQEVTDSQNDESENLNKYFQQATSKFASVNSQQMGNENKDNYYQMGNNNTSAVDLRQLALSANTQAPGGLDINTVYSQGPSPLQKTVQKVQKVNKIASVTPISTNEDISKYFKQPNKISASQSQLNANANLNQLGATANAPISPQEDLDKYFRHATSQKVGPMVGEKKENNLVPQGSDNSSQIKITKINLDMEDLPETFGSANIANYKQTVTTTKTTGNINMNNLPQGFGSDINNYKKVETNITTNQPGNFDLQKLNIDMKNYKLDMEDLPEVFGSSDINKFKQTTTTTVTTTKKEGNKEQKDISQGQNENNFNQVTTTTTTEGIINMKDLPEVFGSFNISNYQPAKVTSTTTTTKEVEKPKDQLPGNLSQKDNNFKQVTTTTTTEGIINMKDLPEVFGSSDINHFKQTKVKTTTTKTKEGDKEKKDLPQDINQNENNFKQVTTTTTEEIINMKDLPEVFGSFNISNYKPAKVTSTTTTTTKEGDLKKGQLPQDNNFKQTTTTTTTQGIIDMKNLPQVFGSSDIAHYKETKTTTTTKAGNAPIDLKGFGIEQNPSTTKEGLVSKDSKEIKQTKKESENAPIDLKEFGMEQNPSANPITENEDYSKYFQQFQTTSEPIDLKQFGIEENPSAMSNFQQTTTTKTTKTETTKTGNAPIDLKGFGMEQNPSANPITENEDYSKYFQQFQTTSEPIDLKQFGIEENPSAMSNFQQTTTTKTTKTETTKTGNGPIDLKQYGIDLNNGNFNQTTTTTKTETSGPIDLKQFGFEQNASSSPVDENEDYNKYFQTTQTTTTKTTGPIDLNQFGIDINSGSSNGGIDLKSLGLDGGQQKTTTTTTFTKTENFGNGASSGGIDLSSFGLDNAQQKTKTTTTKTTTTGNVDLSNFGIPSSTSGGYSTNYGISSDNNLMSYGETQNYGSNYNTSGTTKTTTTKVTKSFAGPTQSYSYNYSYNIPSTGAATVTKTTYSGVAPK